MSARAIRIFAAEDFDAWLPLWRGYQWFYEVDIPVELSRITWQQLLYDRIADRSTFIQYRKIL